MDNLLGPISELIATFNESELTYFNARFAALFAQADSDPVLESTIRDIILNEIFIARYQKEIQEAFQKEEVPISFIDKMHKLVNTLQEKNLSSLDSLNLTKAKKDALNKSPETTPSRLVTGYALAISTMTKAEREKNSKEVEEAMNRLRSNESDLLELIPSDIGDNSIDISE